MRPTYFIYPASVENVPKLSSHVGSIEVNRGVISSKFSLTPSRLISVLSHRRLLLLYIRLVCIAESLFQCYRRYNGFLITSRQ